MNLRATGNEHPNRVVDGQAMIDFATWSVQEYHQWTIFEMTRNLGTESVYRKDMGAILIDLTANQGDALACCY